MGSQFKLQKAPEGTDLPGDSPEEDSVENPRLTQSKLSPGLRILVVDDDIPLCKFLGRELKRRHFSVEVRNDGEAACEDLQKSNCDLLILDLNLPKMSGVAVLKQFRLNHPRLPILVLTARNSTEELVSVLEQGADDYITKPFSFMELQARIRCLLRRNSVLQVSSSKVGDLTINREEHWVRRGERRIDLTAREFVLLDYFMNNVGKALSRATLLREVWNIETDGTSNIVDVYVKYLRDKIDLENEVELIRTVRGVGYVLSND